MFNAIAKNAYNILSFTTQPRLQIYIFTKIRLQIYIIIIILIISNNNKKKGLEGKI